MNSGARIPACLLALSLAVAAQSPPPPSNSGTSQAAPAAEENKVYKVGPGVTPPKLVHEVTPGPPERETAPFHGIVVLRAIVDNKGNVRDLKVEQSLKPYLDELAIDAVRQWRFKPATKDGKPVAVQIKVQINFSLE